MPNAEYGMRRVKCKVSDVKSRLTQGCVGVLSTSEIVEKPIMMRALLCFVVMSLVTSAAAETGMKRLAVAHGPEGKPYLTYGDEPLFAFGPGDEMRIIGGAADLDRWGAWQQAHGMNLVRAYPMSVPLEAYGTPGLHPFKKAPDSELWDVDQFNADYFDMIGKNAARLETYGIILHLQLWQIVFFKGGAKRWDINYINPGNNVNAWTRALRRGRDYIDAPADSPARAHQREWVLRILNAVKGHGNVWIDVINELGNEMGTLAWAVEVVRWIREWERENDWRFLVGVDSEHHYRPGVFTPCQEHFDLIILNELVSPDHARRAFEDFQKPIISVRSSDGRNQLDDYMFVNEHQTGPEHQARYRTLCYRSLFCNLQSVGAYWKMEIPVADYADMQEWPRYAKALRKFWHMIAPEWPRLIVDDAIILSETVTPKAYGLRSETLRLVYLECGPHTWNNAYPASELVLAAPGKIASVTAFHPRNGEEDPAQYVVDGDKARISLPEFVDDVVVMIRSEI